MKNNPIILDYGGSYQQNPQNSGRKFWSWTVRLLPGGFSDRGKTLKGSGEGMKYYETHGEDYFKRTAFVDPSGFLAYFASLLPLNARVLDLGCGSGRDLRWLRSLGFRPVGLESAETLARLARIHSGCPVIQADFETFRFSGHPHREYYDAALSAGSFVHLPHDRLEAVMARILKALKPGGIIYVSVKEGDGALTDALGRPFYFWRDASIRRIFLRLNLCILDFQSSPSALGTQDIWMAYVMRYGGHSPDNASVIHP